MRRWIALAVVLAALGGAAPRAGAATLPPLAELQQRSATVEPLVVVAPAGKVKVTQTQPITCEIASYHVDYIDPVFRVRWARFSVSISYCLTPNLGGCHCGGFVLSPNGGFGQPPVSLVSGSTTIYAPTWRYVASGLQQKTWPVFSPWLQAFGVNLPFSAYGVWNDGEFEACLGPYCRYFRPLIYADYVEFFGGVDKWVTAT